MAKNGHNRAGTRILEFDTLISPLVRVFEIVEVRDWDLEFGFSGVRGGRFGNSVRFPALRLRIEAPII